MKAKDVTRGNGLYLDKLEENVKRLLVRGKESKAEAQYFFLDGDVEGGELAVEVHGAGQGRLEEVVLVLRVQLSIVPAHELGLVG